MADIDSDAMNKRLTKSASSVKRRTIPLVQVAARKNFLRQAEVMFEDFATIAGAASTPEDGVLQLQMDLRALATRG